MRRTPLKGGANKEAAVIQREPSFVNVFFGRFNRVISIVTLLCFLPSSLQFGCFAAWAESAQSESGVVNVFAEQAMHLLGNDFGLNQPEYTSANTLMALAKLSEGTIPSEGLDSNLIKSEPKPKQGKEITAPEYWTRVARLLPSNRDGKSVRETLDTLIAKAYTVRSPKSKKGTRNPDIQNYRPEAEASSPGAKAETSTQETGFVSNDPAVPTAKAVLARGDALLRENHLCSAMQAYFEIVDGWPDSPESDALDNVVNALAWDAETNSIEPAEMLAFVDNLPDYAECRSDKAKYWVVAANQIAGENISTNGKKSEAAVYLERGRNDALRAMREMPDSPYQIFFPGHYVRCCRLLGRGELDRAIGTLRSFAEEQKNANMLKFSARLALTISLHRDYNDITESAVQCGSLLDEYPGSGPERMLKERTVAPNVQAHVTFSLGYAHFQMGHFGTARKHFGVVSEGHGESARLADAALYMGAYLTELAHADDPMVAVEAYSGYMERSSGGVYYPVAMVRLAGVYDRIGELAASAELMRKTVEYFPHFPWTEQLTAAAADKEESVRTGMENKLRTDRLRGDYGEGLCGPFALALMLQDAGKTVDIRELAREAGSNTTGTSLAGLLSAATVRGLDIAAMQIRDFTELRPPALAHFEPNHFAFVRSVDEDGVVVEDSAGQRRLTPGAFMAISSGFVLMPHKSVGQTEWIAQETLESIRGACDEFFSDLSEWYLQCINQQCIKVCKQDRSPGSNLSAGDAGSQTFNLPGAPRSLAHPTAQPQLSFSRSGINLGMTTNHRALTLDETDIHVTSRGGVALEFTRTYSNPWGDHKWYTADESRPFKNNLGSGWGHNWNTHLRVSSQNGYAYHIDGDCQDTRHFTKTASLDGNGNELYTRTPTGMDGEDTNALTEERAVILRRNPTLGWFELEQPDGSVYHYSAPINSQERYCRLEWFSDPSGNTINLTYDNYVIPAGDPPVNTNFGRLARVDAPSGDGRYLAFFYTGIRISRVELRKNATSAGLIKYVDYSYGSYHTLQSGESNPYPNNYLRSVQMDGNVQDCVSYEYDDGEYNGEPKGMYPKKITDKMGHQLNITFEYGILSGETFVSTSKITLSNPDGLVTEFQKSSNYGVYVRNYDGTTVLSRVDYLLGPHGVMVNSVRFYPDPAGASFTEWAYGYQNVYDFTINYRTGATYTYNDLGRVVSAAQGGVYYRYEYPSNGGLYPIKKYGPGTSSDTDKGPVTEYTYDNYGRVTSIKLPDMGSNGITHTYDSYGQLIRITNPMGKYESFSYDNRGNVVNYTDLNGNASVYNYDDFGRIISVTSSGNIITTYIYTSIGGCSSCGGAVGLLATIITPDNKQVSFSYDANGNRLTSTDKMGRATTTVYDSMDRPTTVIRSDGRAISYIYEKLGFMTASIGVDSGITRRQYDYRGFLVRTWLENNPSSIIDDDILVKIENDELGRIVKIEDGLDRNISYTYTSRGDVWQTIHGDPSLTATDPAKIFVTNTYDQYGHLVKTGARRINPFNINIDPVEYFYNNSTGQLTKKRFTNGAQVKDVDYTYDTLGRPIQVDDWMGGTGNTGHYFSYDNNGQINNYTDFDGKALSLVYDARGQVTSMTAYEAGNTQGYTYDSMGRLLTLTAPGNRQWGFTYNDAGQPLSYTWPNGMSTIYAYDAVGRLSRLEHKDGAMVKAGWTYELGADDNIVRVADTRTGISQAWEYEYDGRKRLVHALRLNDAGQQQFRQAFAYDAADNLVSVTKFNLTQTFGDAFADGNYTANPVWTVHSGVWSASTQELIPTPAQGTREISSASLVPSPDLRVDYYVPPLLDGMADGFSIYVRYVNAANNLRVMWFLGSLFVLETVNGVETLLAGYSYVSTATNIWRTLYLQLQDGKFRLYHAEKGKALRLLGGDIVVNSTMSTSQFRVSVTGQSGFRFDNVAIHSRTVDGAGSTAYIYNTSNQLVSSTTNSAVTTYSYDAWGRLLSRTQGAYTANYEWRFGDKLKTITSSFPGEAASVAYNYDGLGKRRNRTTGTGMTWWRSGVEGKLLTKYDDPNTDWAVEGFVESYIPNIASFKGSMPTTASIDYYAHDMALSTRASYNQNKAELSRIDYYPFGENIILSGIVENIPENRYLSMYYDINANMYTSPSFIIGPPPDEIGWGLSDFVIWYYTGNGTPVDLNKVGVTKIARQHPDIIKAVNQQKNDCANIARRKAREKCESSNKRYIHFGFSHFRKHYYFFYEMSVLLVLGKGFLKGYSNCKASADCCLRGVSWACKHDFFFDDMFDEPLFWLSGYHGEVGGIPYNMFGHFEEYSGGFSQF